MVKKEGFFTFPHLVSSHLWLNLFFLILFQYLFHLSVRKKYIEVGTKVKISKLGSTNGIQCPKCFNWYKRVDKHIKKAHGIISTIFEDCESSWNPAM